MFLVRIVPNSECIFSHSKYGHFSGSVRPSDISEGGIVRDKNVPPKSKGDRKVKIFFSLCSLDITYIKQNPKPRST